MHHSIEQTSIQPRMVRNPSQYHMSDYDEIDGTGLKNSHLEVEEHKSASALLQIDLPTVSDKVSLICRLVDCERRRLRSKTHRCLCPTL